MPKGTKFEVGKKYRCTTGIEVECVYAFESERYYCMFGKITKALPHSGYGVREGDYQRFSGEAWSEIIPPPPPCIRYWGVRHSPKGYVTDTSMGLGSLEKYFDHVFKIEYYLDDNLPTVTRIK
ncbi:hypothetical protein SmphiM6_98 [Sinorhizobium phage phiM6]|nr:hypothetical protein SmphiM6_98 [Sinorhizobium phage phiM6]